MYDAEGRIEEELCPECGSKNTVTYHFSEGFTELECRDCGYNTEQTDISELSRYRGDLLESRNSRGDLPPIPVKKIKA